MVLLEWCSKPDMKLLCFAVASVPGDCGDGGKQILEGKTKSGNHKRLMCWCTRPARGGGVAGRPLQMQLFCSLIYPSGSSLSEAGSFFGNGPKALMKAGGKAPGSQGALCLSRLSACSEETHHHPPLSWIRPFEVFCLICVTASVTRHKTFSGFILSPLQFHPPGTATRDKTELKLTSLEIAGVWGTWFPRESN